MRQCDNSIRRISLASNIKYGLGIGESCVDLMHFSPGEVSVCVKL